MRYHYLTAEGHSLLLRVWAENWTKALERARQEDPMWSGPVVFFEVGEIADVFWEDDAYNNKEYYPLDMRKYPGWTTYVKEIFRKSAATIEETRRRHIGQHVQHLDKAIWGY